MISLPLHDSRISLSRDDRGRTTVFDPVRRKWIVLTPEEHVRQALLSYLLHELKYPASLIAVERMLYAGEVRRRFDLVVFDRSTHQPWMLIECKAPEIAITEAALHQLLAYQRHLNAQYWVLCNGINTFCADASNPAAIQWLQGLPAYEL